MLATCFKQSRRAAVSVMFAAAAVPLLGLVGMAVDFGIWNQANATLSVAANVAAMTAVKIAANAQLAGDPNASAEGAATGKQWFASEVGAATKIGTTGVTLGVNGVSVAVTMGPTVTAQVSFAGTLPSVFGNILFFIKSYQVNGSATASVTVAPYLNIEMLLDNSSSMDIGAGVQDMLRLQQVTACDKTNAVYPNNINPDHTTGLSYDPFDSFQTSGSGETYQLYTDSNGSFLGPLAVPVVLVPPYPGFPNIQVNPGSVGPPCTGFKDSYVTANGQTTIPTAGPPCEFACHWDGAHGNSGASQDLYGAARRSLGTSKPIQLRFDLVKLATNDILQQMQTDDLAISNLKVGIFTFNTLLTRVYPGSGEAGDDWGSAITAVGLPPTTPTQEETGILPVIGLRQNVPNDDTNVISAMSNLQSQNLSTKSGDGTTANTPRKVLFLITDGFMDDNSQGRSAFPSTLCNGFKALGYTIYVVFTPYYPIMHQAYLGGYGTIINSVPGDYSEPGTLAYGLAQCASSQSDIISAASLPDLDAALRKFLVAALNAPARFTQ